MLHSFSSFASVLLVDDDDEFRAVLAELFELCGLRVVTASDGAEGLARFLDERPHLVLSDIQMPVRDGLWLVRAIRRLSAEQGGATPTIAVSGANSRELALSAGFDDYLAKPIHPDRMLLLVQEHMPRESFGEAWR